MSRIVKGVKKVFNKVVKTVRKVAPYALAIGAIVFTAGAAAGATGILGAGWGGAASAMSTSLGLSGAAGAALTGAITQAGFGALIGGGLAEATGGDFAEGAEAGALTGLVTGGASGAIGAARAGIAPKGGPATAAPAGAPGTTLPASQVATPPKLPKIGASPSGGIPAVTGATKATQGGMLSRAGQFFRNNKDLVGQAVAGLGQGIGAGADADAEMDLLREQHNLRSSNYAGVDPGRGYGGMRPTTGGQRPMDRFDPRVYGDWMYEYNPQTGRIERVPIE